MYVLVFFKINNSLKNKIKQNKTEYYSQWEFYPFTFITSWPRQMLARLPYAYKSPGPLLKQWHWFRVGDGPCSQGMPGLLVHRPQFGQQGLGNWRDRKMKTLLDIMLIQLAFLKYETSASSIYTNHFFLRKTEVDTHKYRNHAEILIV